jgi:hypothetical protein
LTKGYGHGQEIIPLPPADGRVPFVPVLREATRCLVSMRGFVLVRRPCPGPRHANAGPPTVNGYRLLVVYGSGAEFKRWVTLNDADEDLLKSALLAFEN